MATINPSHSPRHYSLMITSMLIFLVLTCVTSQAQHLEWAITEPGFDVGIGIAVDAQGNSYVAGGSMLVAKYAANGSLLWARRALGAGANGIALDAAGNSYVICAFGQGTSASATFGLGEPHETTLTGGGDCLAKYSSDGTLEWALKTGDVRVTLGIAVDASGVYMTGEIGSPLFVEKRDRNGALVWSTQNNGTQFSLGQGIAVDSHGNSYATGSFSGTTTFGVGDANETSLTSTGDFDIFIAKYGANGALLWARSAGATNADFGRSIAVDGQGNAYVTGDFRNGLTPSVLLAKYTSDGRLVWTKKEGAEGAFGVGVAVDGQANVYVVGQFGDNATFGSGEPFETLLSGDRDVFVAKFAGNGSLVWAKMAGGPGDDIGVAVAVDQNGGAYVTGRFSDTAIFGAGEANETRLVSVGGYQFFEAKIAALRVPRTMDECKRGGWDDLVRANGTSFKNQGDCVSYVNIGK